MEELWPQAAGGLTLARISILAWPGPLLASVSQTLEQAGWHCTIDSPATFHRQSQRRCNLVLVASDAITPDVLDLCVRAAGDPRTRVFVVSRDTQPQTIADTLRAGADDYLIYPFEPDELLVRVRSLVEFALSLPARRRFGSVSLSFSTRTISDAHGGATLSANEWNVLLVLLDADEAPLSNSELATRTFVGTAPVADIAPTISRLRRRLRLGGVRAVQIDTINGRGYALRFQPIVLPSNS